MNENFLFSDEIEIDKIEVWKDKNKFLLDLGFILNLEALLEIEIKKIKFVNILNPTWNKTGLFISSFNGIIDKDSIKSFLTEEEDFKFYKNSIILFN